jgi:TorA maturation chaperone TorD
VLELYAEGGFAIDEEFRDLPDHVAAELEFLYLLLFRQAEACKNEDEKAASASRELARRLLHEHLGRWIGPFAAAVRSGAQTDFYRELADLSARFVLAETAAVGPR